MQSAGPSPIPDFALATEIHTKPLLEGLKHDASVRGSGSGRVGKRAGAPTSGR